VSSESKKVELVLTKVNQLCNLYRDEFGKLDRQGLHLESIQKNYYRPDDDQELKLLKMKNLNFMREKDRWKAYDRNGNPVTLPECKRKSYHNLTQSRIPTVKLKTPGKNMGKAGCQTSVTLKLLHFLYFSR